MQRIEHRFGVLLAQTQTLLHVEFFDLALDFVNPRELLQRELGDLALVGRMQVKELAPGVRQAACLQDAIGKSRLIAIPFKVLPLCL